MRALRPKPFESRAIAALTAILAAHGAHAEDAGPFALPEALARARLTLELRPRYNQIEDSSKPERAEGGTVRVAGGWRSAPHHGLRLTVEAIHADHFGPKRFNDDPARRGASPYPLLPDPRHTGVNRAHVEYATAELGVRVGRQVVRLDNQRWVSDNDFRQIPQLFDGASLAYTGIANTSLEAGHFGRVRTTAGPTRSLALSILRAAWNPAPGHAAAAYAVFHDQAQNGAFTGFADNSYRVVGAKVEGAFALSRAFALPYIAEFARQRPHAGGDARVRADYWRLGAGVSSGGFTARYDFEVKGSNGGLYGLQTPLTDFYQFNGWSLHFFNTPRQGLRDGWLTLRYALAGFTFYAETHRFRSDYANIDFGREHDLGVTYDFTGNCILRLQHARYDPGAGTPDPRVRKTWLTLTYTY